MLASAQTLCVLMVYVVSVSSSAPGLYAGVVNIGVRSHGSSTLPRFWQHPHRTLAGQQVQHRHSTKTCNQHQQLAQAVLDLVATGPKLQGLDLKKQGHRWKQSATPSLHQATATPLPVAAAAAVNVTSTTLQQYIHHLPPPTPPPAWWRLCNNISSKHLTGLKSGLLPQQMPLPDVQGAAAARCQLGRYPWGYTFADISLSAFIAALFYSITAGRAAAAKQLGAPAPSLDRFDLFHGHLFTAWECSTTNNTSYGSSPTQQFSSIKDKSSSSLNHQVIAQLNLRQPHEAICSDSSGCSVGILFHAAEYPAYDGDVFPYNLGHCQVNSSCRFNQKSMDLRNIIWWKGQLAVLDVGAGSPLHPLLHEGTEPLRTLYEEDFGRAVADVLLLKQHTRRRRRKLIAEQQRLQRLYSTAALKVHLARRLGVVDSGSRDLGVFISY